MAQQARMNVAQRNYLQRSRLVVDVSTFDIYYICPNTNMYSREMIDVLRILCDMNTSRMKYG